MVISKIYNSLNKDHKEEVIFGLVCALVLGLVWGLVLGLVPGLIYGLVWGLIYGLAWGLVPGLIYGLVWGLVCALAWGLTVILFNWSEALPFLTGFYPIALLIAGIIILSEIMFWIMPKEKVKKKDLFWHTCKRKIENIFEVLMVLSVIAQVYILGRELNKYLNYQLYEAVLKWYLNYQLYEAVLKWIGYIGAGIFILGMAILIFYVWIKLNSLEYKESK